MPIEETKIVQLTPLKKTSFSRVVFSTFDVETKDGLLGQQLFCWSLASYTSKLETINPDNISILSGNDNLDSLFDLFHLRIQKHRNSYKHLDNIEYLKKFNHLHDRIIFVHNLGFDIRFIMDYCIKRGIKFQPLISGSDFIACTIDELKLVFLDSYQFLQASQEMAEIEWEIIEKIRKIHTIDSKQIFEKDFKYWTKKEKEIVELHNKNDVIALWLILHEFRKFTLKISHVDVLSVKSIASLSMKAFRTQLKFPIPNPFMYYSKGVKYNVDWKKEHFVRLSYFGGRTEVYYLGLCFNIPYIDAVSMYGSVMSKNKYPFGIPIWLGKTNDEINILNNIIDGIDDRLGFILAKIEKGSAITNYPPLPYRIDKKVMYTNLTVNWIYTTVELAYAKSIGYKITPIKGLIYPEKRYIFRDFVHTNFEIKSKYSGGRRKIPKIFVNSVYGKFGQDFIKKSFIVHYFTEKWEFFEFIDNHPNPEILICRYNEEYGIYMIKEIYESYKAKPFMNPTIASFTTSYSRLALIQKVHDAEKEKIPIIYDDTDSITPLFFDSKKIKLSKELGGWEKEQFFIFVKFLAPKAYISLQFDEKLEMKKWVLKLKGIASDKLREIETYYPLVSELSLEGFNYNDFLRLNENEEMFYDLCSFELIYREVKKQIKIAERYMKYNESFRYGLVFATKEPTKEYSYDNLKRLFTGFTSIPWDNNNAPQNYMDEIDENNKKLYI